MRTTVFTSVPTVECDINGRSKAGNHFIAVNSSRRYMRMAHVLLLTLVTAPAVHSAWAQAPTQSPTKPRVEKDLLGEKEILGDAYYGVQTARALENFQLSGVPINHCPGFIETWAIVKLAAAQANTDVGAMKPERLAAIEKASQAVRLRA